MEGRGTIIFGENSSATVNYRFDESGRGNVEYATGSPKWNPVVLLHRKAFRLVLADGREAKVFVLTEDGLAQMAEERTLAHFCDNLNCRCDVVDPNGELPLNPPCPKCGKQMFTTRIVDLDVNQEN